LAEIFNDAMMKFFAQIAVKNKKNLTDLQSLKFKLSVECFHVYVSSDARKIKRLPES
jgi:hypothetical protein